MFLLLKLLAYLEAERKCAQAKGNDADAVNDDNDNNDDVAVLMMKVTITLSARDHNFESTYSSVPHIRKIIFNLKSEAFLKSFN